MDHRLLQDELAQRLGNGGQSHAAGAHPLRHARARDVHARARINLGLPVQRQVIVVLGDDHLREQARRGNALVDDLRRQRCGLNGLAAGTRIFASDVAQHEELGRHAVELLAHVLANALQRLAAGAALAIHLVVNLGALQAGGQLAAHGPAWRGLGGLHRNRRQRPALVLRGRVLGPGVCNDGVEQHPLRARLQALAGRAEAPVLQARQLEHQRLDLGPIELQLGLQPVERSARQRHRIGGAAILAICRGGHRCEHEGNDAACSAR